MSVEIFILIIPNLQKAILNPESIIVIYVQRETLDFNIPILHILPIEQLNPSLLFFLITSYKQDSQRRENKGNREKLLHIYKVESYDCNFILISMRNIIINSDFKSLIRPVG